MYISNVKTKTICVTKNVNKEVEVEDPLNENDVDKLFYDQILDLKSFTIYDLTGFEKL